MMLRFVVAYLCLCLPCCALVALPVSMRSLDRALVMLESAYTLDSECSDSASVAKDTCLAKSAKCMWLELEGKNLCLPCQWSGINIPCVPYNAIYAGKRVKQCQMSCAHQQVLTKVSPCVDVSGSIAQEECFDKGMSALAKCIHTVYKTNLGVQKSICGPCMVSGVGKVPPYQPGNLGPEPGSSVVSSDSQCDAAIDGGIPCNPALGIPGVTNCQAMPPPPGPTSGALPLQDFGVKVDKNAPTYYASIVEPPFGPKEYTAASAAAARAAGWPLGSALIPSAPVVVYGPPPLEGPTLPPDVKPMYGPGPPGIPGLPMPGWGIGTAPPLPSESLLAVTKYKTRRFRLRQKESTDSSQSVDVEVN